MARDENPHPTKGPVVMTVIFALCALGTVPQLGSTRTGAEFWLLGLFVLLGVLWGAKAFRDRV